MTRTISALIVFGWLALLITVVTLLGSCARPGDPQPGPAGPSGIGIPGSPVKPAEVDEP